jgi:hypothetical protein
MYMTEKHDQLPSDPFMLSSGPAMLPKTETARVPSARSRCGRKRFGFYPGEEETIARMLAIRAQGAGFDRIAGQLNNDGVASRSGKPWHGRVVNRILKAEPAGKLRAAGATSSRES